MPNTVSERPGPLRGSRRGMSSPLNFGSLRPRAANPAGPGTPLAIPVRIVSHATSCPLTGSGPEKIHVLTKLTGTLATGPAVRVRVP